MFRRLFGERVEDQLRYLQWRVLVTVLCVAACVVGFLAFSSNWTPLIALVMLFVWGWNVVKTWFGVTTVAAIFSRNVVVGVVLFVFYLIVAYLAGVVFAFLGIGRYLYLKVAGLKKKG